MRAAVLRAHGAPPGPAEHPAPTGAPGVVVSVRAAPVVPLDLLCASGTSYFGPPALPYVPGVQGVGVLETDAGTHPAGTRVWFATTAGMAPGNGSLAQQCAVAPADLVALSADVPDADVAAIGTSGIAAWLALVWRARMAEGERVVVLGASGAVGQVALAVARHRGASRVVAVARSAGATPALLAAGADAVVVLRTDEPRADLAARLAEAAGGAVDVVLDPVFGEPAAAAVLALGPWGRLVNLGGSASDVAELSSAALRGRSISVLGYTNNAISPEQRAEALTAVLDLAAAGRVHVEHRVLPLEQVAEAWALAGRSGPRVVVTLA